MSLEAAGEVFASSLPMREKLIALYLADSSGHDDVVVSSPEKLADRCGCSLGLVRKVLFRLHERGCVTTVHPPIPLAPHEHAYRLEVRAFRRLKRRR